MDHQFDGAARLISSVSSRRSVRDAGRVEPCARGAAVGTGAIHNHGPAHLTRNVNGGDLDRTGGTNPIMTALGPAEADRQGTARRYDGAMLNVQSLVPLMSTV